MISIITICFNNLVELQKTIESIDIQTIKPFQSIIIDASTTSDIKYWLENSNQPLYRSWVCERDAGIYDGFNKGLKKATGKIINFLNSGDCFYNHDVLETVHDAFKMNTDLKWLSAKFCVHRYGQLVTLGESFDYNLLYRGMRKINHQTCFCKIELFKIYGNFNPIKIGMDYDFIIRIAQEKYMFINKIFILFDNQGISSTHIKKALKDNINIYEKYNGFSLKSRLWQLRSLLLFYLFKVKLFNKLFLLKYK
ncbi:MAG: glycosyltransferase [Alphaproteobacteria bacterium]|nr:glycosyltransferase [Alphaproteobacteria bacterium]